MVEALAVFWPFARLFLVWLGILSSAVVFLYVWARWRLPSPGHANYRRRDAATSSRASAPPPTTVAFFHPFANTAGGGERVLWCAIKALEEQHVADASCPYHVIVYTGDNDATPEDILTRAHGRFGIEFTGDMPIDFVYLQKRDWVLASGYRRFTLLGQSLAQSFSLSRRCSWRCRMCSLIAQDLPSRTLWQRLSEDAGSSRTLTTPR